MANLDLKHLKRAILLRLETEAQEHLQGHQGSKASRYVLRSRSGVPIELMFEKGATSPANLWVREVFVAALLDGSLPFTRSPAADLYQERGKTGDLQYGRHSALEKMPQLGRADLVCFALRDMADLDCVLAHLAKVERSTKVSP